MSCLLVCRYWDVFAEYCKAEDNDIVIKVTVGNRGPEASRLHLLPTLWYRNVWVWGCTHEGCGPKPRMFKTKDDDLISGGAAEEVCIRLHNLLPVVHIAL